MLLNPPGKTDKAKTFAASRAASQLRDLRTQWHTLHTQANEIVDRQVRAAYERGVKLADRLAAESGLLNANAPAQGALTGSASSDCRSNACRVAQFGSNRDRPAGAG